MKKTLNKFLKLFLLVVTCFSTFITANAETAPASLSITSYNIGSEPIPFPSSQYNGYAHYIVKKTSDGKYVYCVYYSKKSPNTGVGYTKASLVTDNGMNYILNKGYHATNDNESFKYQTALWVYMVEHGLMQGTHRDIDKFINSINSANSGMGKEIRDLANQANSAGANDTAAPTISVNDSNIKFTLNGNYYVSDKITVNSSTGSYNVKLTNATDIATIEKQNDGFVIKVDANKVSSLKTTINVSVSNSKEVYESYYYNPSNTSYQVMAATYKNTLTSSANGSATLVRTASATIIKVDDKTNEPVSGATLQVLNSNGKIVDTWTTDENAHEVKNLSEGTYTLIEKEAPNGYIKSDKEVIFKIDSNGNVLDESGNKLEQITFGNTKNGGAKISKQDITNKQELPGAHLVVKDYDGNIIEEWISGTEPKYIELKPGTYTLTETIAPNGYILSDETITFTVKEDGSVTDVVMYNTRDGKEIAVEDTASFKTITSSLIGILIIGIGMLLTFKNKKLS